MKAAIRLMPVLIAVTALFGQTFEVASVKPSAPGAPEQIKVGVHIDGARVSFTYLTLKDYIRMAYKVKDYQISGPEWMTSARYDISATLPSGAKQDDVPEMIKALLADRFQLKMHHDTKEFPVYALTVAKSGLKISQSAPDGTEETAKAPVNVTAGGGRNGVSINLGNGAYFTLANNKLEARRITMAYMADNLARFMDRPVVDLTKAAGIYDMTLNFTEEDYGAMLIRAGINAGVDIPIRARQAMEAASGDSLFSAIQTAGLKLERTKAPLDLLVVDAAEKTPSEN